jgi:adenosylmethionine-8-amino-7-oxononanoate aminotransferase
VEVAIKLAIQYWSNKGIPRTRFLALDGAYHGDTFGAMSVSERGVFNTAFTPLLFDVDFIPFPDTPENSAHCLERLEQELNNQTVAALIVEPLVQGAAGMRMYQPQVLEEMMRKCHATQTLTIFDEVMTGFGRTGPLFACSSLTLQPDLICLSKGITGGLLPLGVTTMTSEIREICRSEDTAKTFFHGHSFTGNALSCACALANLDLLESSSCTQARTRINDHHRKFASETEAKFRSIKPRICGTILAIDFPDERPTGYTNPLRHYLLREFLKDNILLRPLGNTVYILPPYCISDEQLGKVYKSIHRVLENLRE